MIRMGGAGDLETVRRIMNDAILNSTAVFDLDVWSPEQCRQWIAAHTEPYFFLMHETDGFADGFASLLPYGKKAGYARTAELSVYVDSDVCGRGIGTELLEALTARAKAEGLLHVIVSVITSENTGSIAFHQRHGFTRCGQIAEAGYKFGRYLSVDIFERRLDC